MATGFPTEQAGLAGAMGGAKMIVGIVEDIILKPSDIAEPAKNNDFLFKDFEAELEKYSTNPDVVSAPANEKLPRKIQLYIAENKVKDERYIGAIRYRLSDKLAQDIQSLPFAFPLNPNFISLPVLNEIVIIHQTENGSYYERIKGNNSPNYSTNVGLIASSKIENEDNTISKQKGIADFKQTESGIPNSNIVKSSTNIPAADVGKYFKRELNYHNLLPYEGDTIFQGRHGQSIRFTGFLDSNRESKKKANPSILIRNGENAKARNTIPIYGHVTEDINEDGTSIHITSGDYLSNFKESVSVKKEANNVYPPKDKLIGDQLIINTGRIILATKANEIYIFSKMSTSFYSDDFFTIDTANGYRAVVQDGDYFTKINGQSNNYVVEINDTGRICMGAEPDSVSSTSKVQQAVKGNALAEILDRLVMVLTDTYQMKTPSGITDFGPVDKSELKQIQTDLKNILSNNNFLI